MVLMYSEARRGGEPTKDLHLAKLPILENGDCAESFKSKKKDVTIEEEHLCAGFPEGKVDGCQVRNIAFFCKMEAK